MAPRVTPLVLAFAAGALVGGGFVWFLRVPPEVRDDRPAGDPYAREILRGPSPRLYEEPRREQPMLRGRVVSEDDSRGTATIDLGARKGVVLDDEFTVSRGNTYVGRVRVTAVEPDRAMVQVVRAMQKEPLRVGDDVMTPTE